jgi:hypothetical protein
MRVKDVSDKSVRTFLTKWRAVLKVKVRDDIKTFAALWTVKGNAFKTEVRTELDCNDFSTKWK